MSLRADVDYLRSKLKPAIKLEVKVVFHVEDIVDADSAIWVVLTV